MTSQLAIRLPEALLIELDELVAAGRYLNRTHAARIAITELVERARRARIDEAIVAGYTRVPPTDDEERWAEAATADLLEERW